jgi:hypothetical protein
MFMDLSRGILIFLVNLFNVYFGVLGFFGKPFIMDRYRKMERGKMLSIDETKNCGSP